ncbi:type II secretion system protein GspM [Methylomarinum sp. Ch1-1]|uniref:Type II secretion system protein GspM n=1 Tax=Methylomarinum roseum TaxID=3067653 RepID=A0AAU7NVQ6_9GAMM|nr:type II secretion system protein GspM [Methylomarinum sp. Ch1-1]MDP4522963.1 type II secretion system protein GspM [Methylomarinum sp. Ch1-1]
MLSEISYQRWMAIGLLLCVVMLVIFAAIVPLVSTGLAYHEEKQELAFRLQRYRQIAARKDDVAESIKRIKQQYQAQGYFSNRDTVALASADLQKFIKSAIAQAGGELTSTQVLPSSHQDGLLRISVKVRMSGDIEVLRNVLYEIESSVPVVIIDQIDVRPVRGRRNRKTRRIEPSNRLNVNFQAVSFMRAEPS